MLRDHVDGYVDRVDLALCVRLRQGLWFEGLTQHPSADLFLYDSFWVWGLRVWGMGFEVWGLGFGVWGSGLRV